MKTLMIDKMNEEKQLMGEIIEIINLKSDPELAELKANEIMRIFGYSYKPLSADDRCPYCGVLSNENELCNCGYINNCYESSRRIL